MTIATANKTSQIMHQIIYKQDLFPNNEQYPLLIYRAVFSINQLESGSIINLLNKNNWGNAWVNGIYDYHHYHSNSHEVLVVIAGSCDVIYGGPKGKLFFISEGDVILHPAGVSHKKEKSSKNFSCIGAYPDSVNYDMNYGKASEHPSVDLNIQQVKVPLMDPVFGKTGPMFEYWR